MGEFGNISIVFVCHKGEIETKSLLLAYSLRKAIGSSSEIIAVIPKINGDVLTPEIESLEILENLHIKMQVIANEFLGTFGKNLHGNLVSNKIYALKAEVAGEYILLLDSDILCLSLQEWQRPDGDFDLVAKQANRCGIKKWEEIYKLAGLKVPSERFRCTVDNQLAPLYLNSGVLLMKKSGKSKLFNQWLEYFNLFSTPDIQSKHLFDPFFRDQVALSLAIRKLEIKTNVTGENLNFPMRVRGLSSFKLPVFAHYHDIPTIMSHAYTRTIVCNFISSFNAKPLFYNNITWKKWLEAGKLKLVILRTQYKIPRFIKPLLKRPLQRLRVIISSLLFKIK